MHVLYVIDSLAPGGAEQSLASIAPFYRKRGVDLDVAYLQERPGLHAALEAAGATLFSLQGPRGRLGWAERLTSLVRERRPDLVHTTLFEADIAGRIASIATGVPVVCTLAGLTYDRARSKDPVRRRWKARAAQLLDAVTARRVTRFHAVAAHVAEWMVRRLAIPRGRIDFIPRGRDPVALGERSADRSRRTRDRLGLADQDAVLVTAARHDSRKGLDVLLQAMPTILRDIPEARLLVAGREGDHTERLKSIRSRLGQGDAVLFLGARDDVPDLLAVADVFVMPSRSEGGFPGSFVEAMALEAPIVATESPAVMEVVGDLPIALLAPRDDPRALAAAVTASLGDPAAARERARLARGVFLERYVIEEVADRMVSFYERALKVRPRPRVGAARP
jgi:glycosyltransferase involved in cell wall biosynthesis